MAAEYDLTLIQGATFSVRLAALNETGAPIDLSNWSISGLARFTYSNSSILMNLNPTKVPGFESQGHFDLTVPAYTTALLPVVEGVYDVEIRSGIFVSKILRGYIDVLPEVTY
jgi:hypothetical protein